MNLMRKPVLVLNHAYEPSRIIWARKALTMMSNGKAQVIVYHKNKEIYPGIFLPSVIRLVGRHYVPFKLQQVSRKNIFTRDGYKCMYCGRKGGAEGLELEHIIPKCQGGKNTWDNLVASCRKCNQRKGDKTPEQAGMTLIHRPLPQSIHTPRFILRALGSEVEEWGHYLFNDPEGDQRYVARG